MSGVSEDKLGKFLIKQQVTLTNLQDGLKSTQMTVDGMIRESAEAGSQTMELLFIAINQLIGNVSTINMVVRALCHEFERRHQSRA